MKKQFILLSFLFGLAIQSFGQASNQDFEQDLLDKSQRQKKTGVILLGAGGASLVQGGVLILNGSEEAVNCLGSLNCTGSEGEEWAAGTVLFIAGGLAMLGSVPFFISAGNNKQGAAKLSLDSKPIYLPRNTHNGPRAHPAIQISIPLY